MSTLELWALGVGGWLAVGALVAFFSWWTGVDDAQQSLGCYLIEVVFWPIILVVGICVLLVRIQVPPRHEWAARRREAAERRARPSEVTPSGKVR